MQLCGTEADWRRNGHCASPLLHRDLIVHHQTYLLLKTTQEKHQHRQQKQLSLSLRAAD